MTTAKKSWFKRSLAVLLAVMMVMSMGISNVFAAEPTVYDKLNALLDEIDSLDGDKYVKSGYDALMEQAEGIVRPVRPPEDDAVCGRGQKLHAVSDRGSHGVHPELWSEAAARGAPRRTGQPVPV